VSGGDQEVRLLRGDEVLRCSRGRRSNAAETAVRWSIDEFRGELLRLEIRDDSTSPWGFVSAGAFRIAE
jgi:hypothetical protein